MRKTRGRVEGKVVVLESALPDGAEVDVVVRDANADGVDVTDEEWGALMEAAAGARQGTVVDASTVLAELSRRRR
ncbi:MAG: hypothetical protein JNM17_36035 [Archangium sp.]|nr:hypothetical protein [Archangium sp.]